ncbi:MAG: hypothetical protein K0R17_151 [Rariglobus sp.]|jgi:outer membrane biosynthesis protein TonB|nr:hypothetical protein [Rariglobus sp.]
MSSSQRLVVELSTYFLQAAVAAGGRLVAHREFAPDDAAGLASFIAENATGLPLDMALIAPASSLAELLPADAPASQRTVNALLARTANIGGSDALLAACDVVEGRIPMTDVASAWLVTAITADDAHAASRQLNALGLAPATWAPALPSELGAVVELIRDTPGASRVVVWEPGESSARLWTISPAGIESVREAPAGFTQIFETVQTELGLKFRAAATKLFFNASYDFGEAADRIAARLGTLLRDALGETPPALHVLGLPSGQAWLPKAIAKSLGTTAWSPSQSTAYARYGVAVDLLSPRVVGLLQAAAAGWVGGQWLPAWITPATVLAATANATPAPVPAPAPAPTPPAAPAVVPAAPKPASKIVPPAPKPAPKPAPAPAAPPAKTPAPVRPSPAPAPAAPAPAAQPKTPFPLVPVLVGLVALVVVVGTIVFIRRPASKPAPTSAPVAASAAKPAPAATSAAAAKPTGANPAALEAEVKRDPLGFKNDRYQFSVSSKGVLTDFLAAGRPKPWIRNLGFMRLYGVSTLPDGGRAVRRAGDMSSPDYRAKVNKRVRDGVVVFDVDVSHPKFAFTQTFVCLPGSLKVEVRFKPTALTDNQGPLDAIYGVHFETADFHSATSKPLMEPGSLTYGTKRGPLVLRHGEFKGPGPQPVVGDPALASFVLAMAGQPSEQVLNYEITLP